MSTRRLQSSVVRRHRSNGNGNFELGKGDWCTSLIEFIKRLWTLLGDISVIVEMMQSMSNIVRSI